MKKYEDYCVESDLSNGDKTLSFLYPSHLAKDVQEECYIRNKKDEFVVKSINDKGKWKSITATLNLEDLEGKVFENFDTTNKTISECISLALAGTGWTIGTCNVTRRRTVRKTNCSSFSIIQEAKKIYRCELEFDTINKRINIFEKRGSDKGVYFIDSLNLISLEVQSNSYDFYTRLIAIGKGDLKVTVENFQYSNKVKTYIWKDERYTNLESPTEDATAKLNDISKPYKAYIASILDLANINEEYKDILNYELGDIITLISKDKEIKEKQRIVKIVEYPDEPYRNTCEIANTILKFEDIQKEFQDTTDTVNNITTDNGTIDGNTINGIRTEQIYDFEAKVGKIVDLEAVNARIDVLYAEKANVGELNAVVVNVAELNATKLNVADANIQFANINTALIGKADITELNAVSGKIDILESDTAYIKNLVNGNLTSDNIHSLILTSSKVTVENGFIKNAMIENVDVSKLNAGTISTDKFLIKSNDGGIEIRGATQQFKDKNNKVRLQLGKDSQGNFNFILRGEDGTSVLLDHTGLKAKAITDGLIVNSMLGQGAVTGDKVNIGSLIQEVNKDANTSTIKATKIQLDKEGQSLDIAFNTLKTNVNNIQVGGRNLIKNSLYKKGSENWSLSSGIATIDNETLHNGHKTVKIQKIGVTTSTWGGIRQDNVIINPKQGEKYTLSYWYLVKDKTTLNDIFALELKGRTTGGTDTGLGYTSISPTTVVEGEWTKVSFVLTINRTDLASIFLYGWARQNGVIWFSEIKAEKGNKATDFTEAPEDVENRIESNTTKITAQQGKIEALISDTSIVEDGTTKKLKDAYASLKLTVNGLNSTVGSHTTNISNLQGQINTANSNISNLNGKVQTVESKQVSFEQNLSGISQKVSSTESNVTTLTGKVNTANNNISTLQGQMNTVNNNINNVTNNLNNLQIGGRNLLIDTKLLTDKAFETIGTATRVKDSEGYTNITIPHNATNNNLKAIPTVKNNKYTLSFEAKTNIENLDDNILLIDFLDSDKRRVTYIWQNGNIKNYFKRYTVNITVPNNDTIKYIMIGLRSSTRNSSNLITYRKLKLESGTKATDYTEAPEDVEADIIAVDGKVNTVTVEVTTTKNKVAQIETTVNGINQKVSSVESTTTTLTGKINAANSNISTLQGQMATANNNITSVANNLNNLQIGGRNLLKATSSEFKEVSFGGWDYYFPNNLVGWNKNEQITGRIYLKPTKQDASCMIHVRYNDTTYSQYRGNVIKAGTEGYSICTITIPNRTDISHIQFSIRHSSGSTPTDRVMYKLAKVEKGNKATDWSPAPEDVQAQIDTHTTQITTTNSKVASIETNLSSITSRVSSTESSIKTINGNVTSLQDRMSTAEHKITSDSIVSTVRSSTAYTNDLNAKANQSALNTTNSNLSGLTTRVNSVEQKITPSSITTTISSAINGGTSSISTTQFVMDRNGFTVKNGAITVRNKSGQVVLSGNSNGDLTFNGYLVGKDQQVKLIGDTMKIDGRNGALRFQYDSKNYLYLHPTEGIRYYTTTIYNLGITAPAFHVASDGHFSIYTGGARLKLLKSGNQIQSRTANDSGYASVAASDFYPQSSSKFKSNIKDTDDLDFMNIVNKSMIRQYNFKTDVEERVVRRSRRSLDSNESVKPDIKLGVVVEELPEEVKKYLVPNNSEGISLYNMTSILWGAFQEQQKKIDILESKIKILESA